MALPIDCAAEAVTRLSQMLNAQLLDCDTATINLITTRPVTPGPQRYLIPTGPCTIGAHVLGDAIHLVCVTDNSQSTFWAYVAECLDSEDLPRRDGVVAQIPESGGAIWLHYCGVSSFRQRFEPLTLDQPDVLKLNALPRRESAQDRLWDARALLRSVRNDDSTMLRDTYTLLRTWAEASGICGADSGTLSLDALLAMVHEVCSGLWSPAAKDANEAITRITSKYADSAQLKLLRTPSGRVAYSPDRDIAADGRAAIAEEMRRACADPRVMHFSVAEHFNTIRAEFNSCIQISAECWTPKQHAAFQARLVPDVAFMFGKLRSLAVLKCERCRFWPHAFKQSEDEWVYSIFVDASHTDGELSSAVEQHAFAFDNDAGSAHAVLLAGNKYESAMSRLLTPPATPTPSGNVDGDEEHTSAIGNSPSKFPTASAVLSRLRWDPKYVAEHYEVGYMDRFVGLLWLPLEKWGHATEDEEFIPAHRIRTFRRVRDGAVIKSEDTRKRLSEHIRNGGGGRRGSDDPAVLQRVKLEGVSVDLTQLRTVKELAEELLRKGEKLDRVICNAGIGGWLGTDFLAGTLALIKNPIQAATYPLFQISDVGALAVQRDASSLLKPDEKQLPPMGQVFTANLFGHYLLLHWLMPILTPSSRLIWITSTTCLARFFSLQDPQCIGSTEAYESSKRLTDLLILTSNLPSTAPYTSKYLSSGNGSAVPKMYTTHPGILKTNIAPVPWFLDLMNLLTLYLVRLLGSPWHPVTPYPGASSAVFCALAPSIQLDDVEEKDGKGKWGSAVGRLGGDSVRRTEVQGWGFCGKISVVPEGSVDLKASRWPNWNALDAEAREEFEVTGREAIENLRKANSGEIPGCKKCLEEKVAGLREELDLSVHGDRDDMLMAVRPAFQLASAILQDPSQLAFWHGLMVAGQDFDCNATTEHPHRTFYAKDALSVLEQKETLDWLERLGKGVVVAFEVLDPSDLGETWCQPMNFVDVPETDKKYCKELREWAAALRLPASERQIHAHIALDRASLLRPLPGMGTDEGRGSAEGLYEEETENGLRKGITERGDVPENTSYFRTPWDEVGRFFKASFWGANDEDGQGVHLKLASCCGYEVSKEAADKAREESKKNKCQHAKEVLELDDEDKLAEPSSLGTSVLDLAQDGHNTAPVLKPQDGADVEKSAESSLHDGPDPYLVAFSPNDPLNPWNFPTSRRAFITFQLGMLALAGSLGSSIIAPAEPRIARYLHLTHETTVLTVALYVLGFAFGPSLWAPISETYGRKISMLPPVLALSVMSVGTGFSRNAAALFLTRFFGGVFASAPISNVSAALGDMYEPSARGIAVTFYAVCVCGGPTLGPVIGSAVTVTRGLGWRWTEFIEAIWAASVFLLALVFMPELYPPVLLKRKAEQMRKETGDERYWHPHEVVKMTLNNILTKHLSRPLRMFFTEPMVTCIAIYASFVYGLLYLTLEVFPIVYREHRHMGEVQSTLPFLGLLVGVISAMGINLGNQPRYSRIVAANKGRAVPEARLPPMVLGGVLFVIGIFWFGWTADPKFHWAIPTVATVFIGAGFNVIFQQCINFLVDTYALFAASAVSANTVLRSLSACALPLVARPMFLTLGVAPACSILGGVAILALPVPFVFMRYGLRLRKLSKFAPVVDD
nr:hypothetical protein B0A51_11836 [Rachicladosporium sp. CCFEE 5018]